MYSACARFCLHLLPSWSLLLGLYCTIQATLLDNELLRSLGGSACCWDEHWLICGTASPLVDNMGNGSMGFSGRHISPIEQLTCHVALKHFADEVPDVNLGTAEVRPFRLKSSYALLVPFIPILLLFKSTDLELFWKFVSRCSAGIDYSLAAHACLRSQR